MSTISVINVKHPSSASNNLVTDSSGNTTAAGTVAMGSSFLRNRIINGAMVIDQRNAGAAVTTAGYYVDRWKSDTTFNASFSVQQNAGSVTPPVGFTNYLGFTSTAAYSPGTNTTYCLTQSVEGYNVADFAWGTASAKTITISFWVRSSLTGTFSGAVTNNVTDRSYVFSFSINAATTWEYKTITIPGDTTGTWLTNNGIGLNLRFNLGTGTGTFGTTTANAWQTGNFVGLTSGVQVSATNGATFYITGVQLEVGTVATPFERRLYGTELALCQRYFTNWVGDSSGTGFRAIGNGYVPAATTDLVTLIPLSVSMRTTPTLSYSGSIGVVSGNIAGTVSSIPNVYASSNQSMWAIVRTGATFVTGQGGIVYTQNASTNFFSASAEL